ncbi:MAG: iron-containing alcohol dehydrogenase [Brevinema sp.]
MLDFNYFHIPTRIIQGYESYTNLRDLEEIVKKRVIMVTDSNLMNMGATQNLRRFIENVSQGLIFYEVSNTEGVQDDALALAKESKAQTIIGFGDSYVLSVARAMVQFSGIENGKINYIEIPSVPCIYTGLLETYYFASNYETLKKPYKDLDSRADWLLLDSSYTEYIKVNTLLEAAAQSLAYAWDTLLSRDVTMLAESYVLKAMELIVSVGNRLPNEPTNIKLKNELMLASLLVSFAIQSSNLGICAGLAMALENSMVCREIQGAGAVLMASLEYSLVSNLDKFQKVARILGIEEKDPLDASVQVLKIMQELLQQMEIKPLSAYTFTPNILELSAKQASRYRFMLSLSRPAGYYELTEIIKNAVLNGIAISDKIHIDKILEPSL